MQGAVVVRVQMGGKASGEPLEEGDLRVELARDLLRPDFARQFLEVPDEPGPGQERRKTRRIRGRQPAARDSEVETEREAGSAADRFRDPLFRRRFQHHRGRRRHDAGEVRLEHSRVDAARPSEVVGVDDETLHGAAPGGGSGCASASSASFTAPIAGAFASVRTRACGVSRRRATSDSRMGTAAKVPPERTTS